MNRRSFLAALGSLAALSFIDAPALAQDIPSEEIIMRRLDAAPQRRLRPQERVTIDEFKRRPELRRAAPSIDIQAINFATGSDAILPSEFSKVARLARGLELVLRRRPASSFLIEGHTDAVGTRYSNQLLSERRAASLRRVLVREFRLPARALETVGYGEDFLLVPTQGSEWRNRRVTIRRIDEFLR